MAAFLAGCGFEVAGFDLADGADVLDLAAVSRAARGCAAVVHLAALAHDSAGSPGQIMAVNVLGTWHVLLAAEAAGAGRVICFSSAQVFGIDVGQLRRAANRVGDRRVRQVHASIGKRETKDVSKPAIQLAIDSAS